MTRVGKAVRAEFGGKERLFLFSFRVAKASKEHAGDGMDEIDYIMFLAGLMMNAGAKYAQEYGIENPDPMTEEQMLDLCSEEDMEAIWGIVAEVKKTGSKTDISTGSENEADENSDSGNGDEKNVQGAKPEN